MMDITPLSPSSHSPTITLRRWIARAIRIAPPTIAQAPIRNRRARAVMPGHTKVSAATATPKIPCKASKHRDERQERDAGPQHREHTENYGCNATQQPTPPRAGDDVHKISPYALLRGHCYDRCGVPSCPD